jgi:hypothetical protein
LSTRREYTSFLAGNDQFIPWAPSGAYDSIATVTLGSSASSINFTSIPSTYTHLQVRVSHLSSAGANFYIRLNSDTGSNYAWHELVGDGTTVGSYNASSVALGYYAYSASGANPTVAVIDFLDYKNTNKNKTVRALAGNDNNGSGRVTFTSSLWQSTSAVNAITIYPSTGTFSQYSSFALYGIKGD